MKARWMALLCLGLALIVGVAGAADPPQLLVATVADAGTPWADQLGAIQARAEDGADDPLRYRPFLGVEVNSEAELALAVADEGVIQGALLSTTTLAVALDLPVLLLPELPYLFRDLDEVDLILDELLFARASEALAERGLVLASWTESGWRHLGTRAPAVRRPEDLAGRSLRAQPDHPLNQWILRAMGARRATPMPVVELRPRLISGDIAGFDATPVTALLAGWLDQVDAYSLTQHSYQAGALVYRADALDALTPEQRAAVLGDARADAASARAAVRELDAQVLRAIQQKGVELVTPEDLSPFAEATLSVHARFLEEHSALRPVYDEVMEMLESHRVPERAGLRRRSGDARGAQHPQEP
ncbi:MAG: TRAP transporter substrate-binding protein DctP [Alphaproteobacteria bacterium]|nr:TRAP transporter substrate-binding protein DctP [Alphaproteobacteria bacterium]